MIAPAHSRTTAAVAALDRIAEARTNRNALRIHGNGTWLDAGRPVSASASLSLDGANGIVEYVPGDLTMTVGAATTLADIASATLSERQWLPLDPAGTDDGTIGGTVATNSAGALAHAFGTPRDQVLGLEFVTGAGTVVRGGGRVVKNVAGFDLTRLLVGSWGTLGVITEVSLRLRALPERESTVAMRLPSNERAREAVFAAIAQARLAAYAIEIINDSLAARLGLGDQPLLLARLGGNADLVKAQQETLASLGELRTEIDATVWKHLRGCDAHASAVMRFSQRRSKWSDTWQRACDLARLCAGFVHGSPGRGVARLALMDVSEIAASREMLGRFEGTVIFERLPSTLWTQWSRPTAVDSLSRGVKHAFDPDGILNPGILGEAMS